MRKIEDLVNVKGDFIKGIQHALHDEDDQKYMYPEKILCMQIGIDLEKDEVFGWFNIPGFPSIHCLCTYTYFTSDPFRIQLIAGEHRYDEVYFYSKKDLEEVENYVY